MAVQATVNPHTIVLVGDLLKYHQEAPADAALKPGHIIKKNSDGEVLKHATAGGRAPYYVAKEQALVGDLISTAFAAGDVVPYHIAQRGDVAYCRLPASASAVVIGDQLCSNGDGCLKKGNGTTDVTLAEAEEAVDNSAGSGEVFIRARFW